MRIASPLAATANAEERSHRAKSSEHTRDAGVKLLIGTGNAGKIRELETLLSGLDVELTTPAQLGLDLDVDETGETLEENARLKARAYANAGGMVALADDSGLFVDALIGAPGVRSARYGAPQATTDEDRVSLLLNALAGVPESERTAAFRCVIVIAKPGSSEVHIARGELRGIIEMQPRGTNGFGYDPVFLLPDRRKTMAELESTIKNRISHRGLAAQAARGIIETLANQDAPTPNGRANPG